MSEFKAYKIWIGDDPELYGIIVNLLTSKGYEVGMSYSAGSSHKNIALTTNKNGKIDSATYIDKSGFKCWPVYEEINIDWMRTKKPETIELNGKTYIKSELEEALRHIKPVEV
ncbi:hypothetical protein KA005_08605 [bacterium]|nr:hypothetical protein [bacterium]